MKDLEILAIGEIPSCWRVGKNKKLYYEYQVLSETGDEELLPVSHITGITLRSGKNANMILAESMEGYKRCSPGDFIINTMWA